MRNAILGFSKLVIGFFFFFLMVSVMIENDTEHLIAMIVTSFCCFFLGFTASYDGAKHFFK
jgi:hypothetical protein